MVNDVMRNNIDQFAVDYPLIDSNFQNIFINKVSIFLQSLNFFLENNCFLKLRGDPNTKHLNNGNIWLMDH